MEYALTYLLSWSPTAISAVLVFVVLFLIRQVDKNSRKDEARSESLRKEIAKVHDDVNNTLNRFGERLSVVEKDYVKNDLFFRELSGWRSEINRLSDQITTHFMSFSQSVFKFWSGKKL